MLVRKQPDFDALLLTCSRPAVRATAFEVDFNLRFSLGLDLNPDNFIWTSRAKPSISNLVRAKCALVFYARCGPGSPKEVKLSRVKSRSGGRSKV
jgi:hypothetical protein